jgi:hypothetical protein
VSEPRPRLEVLDGGGERRGAPAKPAGQPARGRRRPSPLLLLGGLALLLAVALALALRQGQVLGARVERLSGELASARAELAATRSAYQGHLARARDSVGALEGELAALRELLARDPLAPASQLPEADAPAAP